jgi:hypothetical protein
MLSVMVVSRDSRFLDCVGDALQGEGMWAVCIEKSGAVMDVVQRGYRPEAIVVDPAAVLEPGAGELVRYFAESPVLAGVPLFSISSAAKRVEVAGLLDTLRRLEGGGEHAYG